MLKSKDSTQPQQPFRLYTVAEIAGQLASSQKMSTAAVRVIRDRKAETKASANLTLKIVGYVFSYGTR